MNIRTRDRAEIPALEKSLEKGVRLQLPRAANLAEQTADAIVNGIASGALIPGQRLVEAELAAALQISRVPLRESLKILETQGIVASTPHRGTFVAAFDPLRVDQICTARIALERIALPDAVAAYARAPDLLQRLDEIIARMEAAATRLAWLDVSRADLDFHREICRVSENSVVLTLWQALARHVLIVFGHEIRDEQDAAAMGPQHRRVRDLLASGDAETLWSEIDRHIMRLRNRPRTV